MQGRVGNVVVVVLATKMMTELEIDQKIVKHLAALGGLHDLCIIKVTNVHYNVKNHCHLGPPCVLLASMQYP